MMVNTHKMRGLPHTKEVTMTRLLRFGLDVHTTNYTICVAEPVLGTDPLILLNHQVEPDYRMIIDVINKVEEQLGEDEYDILCGYEAGCLGYSLYHDLVDHGINCVILAPTTMQVEKGKRIKTDFRDAQLIATCLCHGGYKAVHIPTWNDDEVKEYIRMRDDHMLQLKKVKQQINALCTRHGYTYQATKWTEKHLQWLGGLTFTDVHKETLGEYLITYYYLVNKLEAFDRRIEEFAHEKEYEDKVGRLCCLLGIRTNTAMALIAETGDFSRFPKGDIYAHYLGLAPGENSSSDKVNRLSITKAGNTHLRKLLVETAQSVCRGAVGYKSKALKARQNGMPGEVIAYADKANERFRRKYYRLINKGKPRNVAVTAIAREMACFIWGLMTDNIA